MILALASTAHADCFIVFDCPHGKATINGATFPLACASTTGAGWRGGVLDGKVIKADGPWRPGLVAPGTPMIDTVPRLCYDCFIHAWDGGPSNGCAGIAPAGFEKLARECLSSQFVIIPGRTENNLFSPRQTRTTHTVFVCSRHRKCRRA